MAALALPFSTWVYAEYRLLICFMADTDAAASSIPGESQQRCLSHVLGLWTWKNNEGEQETSYWLHPLPAFLSASDCLRGSPDRNR